MYLHPSNITSVLVLWHKVTLCGSVFFGRYSIEGQFSLAINIPVDQDLNNLDKVFEKDPFATVIEKVSKHEVYQGTNVVAAKFKNFGTFTDHAEARVLDKIKPLADRSKGNFLVLYSYLSPCSAKCTNAHNEYNILDKINKVISKWEDYAFVFSKVFDRTKNGTIINKTELVEALKRLGGSNIGHNNIFRCYRPKKSDFQCISCYINGKLSDECVNNKA